MIIGSRSMDDRSVHPARGYVAGVPFGHRIRGIGVPPELSPAFLPGGIVALPALQHGVFGGGLVVLLRQWIALGVRFRLTTPSHQWV